MREVSRTPIWINNGYRCVTVRYEDGSTRTVYEHREVMERLLGRPLRSDEHVHHKDRNRANNSPANLELESASDHGRRHAAEDRPAEMAFFTCSVCGTNFTKLARAVRHNQGSQGKAGPFCSRKCAGKRNADVRFMRT